MHDAGIHFKTAISFNRYMVECESCHMTRPFLSPSSFNRYMVECEFLFLFGVCQRSMRFNRYMVECESQTTGTNIDTVEVLIDTWWNVNTLVQ